MTGTHAAEPGRAGWRGPARGAGRRAARAATATGPETLDALRKWQPDIAIIAVRMPPTNSGEGLKAALAAPRAVPDCLC